MKPHAKISYLVLMICLSASPVFAADDVIPGADLGKAGTLPPPPPPRGVAPQPDPAANAPMPYRAPQQQPQMQPQMQQPQMQPPQGNPPPADPNALTRPVPGYTGGPYVKGGDQYWLPNNQVPQVGSPYYYSATQGAGGTYGMTSPRVGIRAGQTWFGGYDEANTGAQNQALMGSGDPYTRHFGPGFYRSNEYGHYYFPSYSYRRPWYNPGAPTYNRDTNYRW
ncbi:hypothetical protein Pan153_28430 [Gimesia panareensis]|uniref:IgA FC receptor n=1 Tax=Gimesia panareensis TaxID=2527978 RepID=A0A518FPA9_9PLAN|nr:hypothetical protein [Gimesia panareensis]QDV18186.1 hypothetical protein Pan153_28430 [Gimesia panareensis]